VIYFTRATLASAGLRGYQLLSCVCLSIRPSQVSVLPKRLNVGSRKQSHTIAEWL